MKPKTAHRADHWLLRLLANGYQLQSTLSSCLWVAVGCWVLRHLVLLMFPILTLGGAVRATPKSNSVDNVRALQGDAMVLENAIKL